MKCQLLEILRCPRDQTPLNEADRELLAQINRAILDGRLNSCSGKPQSQPIEGGLVRAARDILYPIVDGIPLLLWDEAIPLDPLSSRRPA